MRHRTAAILFAGAAATGAAAIAALTTRLFAADAAERQRRTVQAIADLAFRRPPLAGDDLPATGQRPELVLVKSGPVER
jgi:hypothetical protein